MNERKDITEFLLANLGIKYFTDRHSFNVFEKDGFLYRGDYDDFGCIETYSPYNLLCYRKDIENDMCGLFNVKIADTGSDLICRCGEYKLFSAFYGDYEIKLRCNSCNNTFTGYSG